MTYTPRGFPKAAIDYITEHGPQFSGPLAEAIGCDLKQINQLMDAALRNGALVKERKQHLGYACNFWSLGDGMAVERPKDEPLETDGVMFERPAIAAAFTALAPNTEARGEQFRQAFADIMAKSPGLPPAPTCTESQTEQSDEPPCEFAITSAGRLLIDTGSQKVALTKAQADQLMAYLDAQRGIEWEAA